MEQKCGHRARSARLLWPSQRKCIVAYGRRPKGKTSHRWSLARLESIIAVKPMSLPPPRAGLVRPPRWSCIQIVTENWWTKSNMCSSRSSNLTTSKPLISETIQQVDRLLGKKLTHPRDKPEICAKVKFNLKLLVTARKLRYIRWPFTAPLRLSLAPRVVEILIQAWMAQLRCKASFRLILSPNWPATKLGRPMKQRKKLWNHQKILTMLMIWSKSLITKNSVRSYLPLWTSEQLFQFKKGLVRGMAECIVAFRSVKFQNIPAQWLNNIP